MEYPGTRFTRPIRLALLISLIIVFFVISPLIIMYTAGYRYDWQHGLLKETGAINIDVEPETASVYLNNVKLQEKIPVRMNNIIPAKYTVRITNPEYFDWTKEIEVKNKQTNYIKEITLLKKSKPEILVAGNIINFAISSNGRFLMYAVKENNATTLWLWDNNSKQTNLLFRWSGHSTPNIVWAEKNNYAVVTSDTLPYTELFVIDTTNPAKQIDISKGTAIHKFQWTNSVEPQLYYSTKENFYLYFPATQKTQIITANNFVDWYVENGQLWTLGLNSTTQQYMLTKDTLGFSQVINQFEQNKLEIIIDSDPQEPNTNIGIAIAQQNTALLYTNIMGRMFLVNDNKLQPMQIENFLISKYNNWWLLWSHLELWSYNENEIPYLLNRSGQQLQEVIPLDQYNTLALVWADNTTALFPYYSVSHKLLDGTISNVAADTENKILYFIQNDDNQDKTDNGIWKLNY